MRCVSVAMFTSIIDLTLFQSLDSNGPRSPNAALLMRKSTFTPCEGSRCQCDGWVVTAHPRHTTGGARMNFTTGRMEPFEATPEWVAQQEAQIEQGGRSNVGCGPPR